MLCSYQLIQYSYGALHRYLMLSIYVPLIDIMLVTILGMCRVIEIKMILGKGQVVTNAVKIAYGQIGSQQQFCLN